MFICFCIIHLLYLSCLLIFLFLASLSVYLSFCLTLSFYIIFQYLKPDTGYKSMTHISTHVSLNSLWLDGLNITRLLIKVMHLVTFWFYLYYINEMPNIVTNYFFGFSWYVGHLKESTWNSIKWKFRRYILDFSLIQAIDFKSRAKVKTGHGGRVV